MPSRIRWGINFFYMMPPPLTNTPLRNSLPNTIHRWLYMTKSTKFEDLQQIVKTCDLEAFTNGLENLLRDLTPQSEYAKLTEQQKVYVTSLWSTLPMLKLLNRLRQTGS